MEKDFDGWARKKKELHNRIDTPFYHEREIWWCSMGVNIGVEKEGKYYAPIGVIEDREASINLSQIRLFDTKRLVRKMTRLDTDIFNQVLERVTSLLVYK